MYNDDFFFRKSLKNPLFRFSLYWADSGLNKIKAYDLGLQSTMDIYSQQSANFYGISIFQVDGLYDSLFSNCL